ncbi:27 kDa hemolymph protein [Phthorimaea operculella]|nr:27 kDa hemolymph protein [Phthorimaea operculella]
MFKLLFVAFLAVGALAEYEVSDAQKQQFRAMLTEVCKKNNAEDKVDDVEKAVTEFVECGKAIIDPNVIRKEIEEAKPNGALDEVFAKYCAKSPEMKSCISNVLTKVTPCMDPALKDHIVDANNATSQLIDFVCYKDGDRIALFIAEQGPECFQSKANEIRECANTIKNSVPSVEEAKKLSLQEQCSKYDTLSQCIVNSLEKCSTPTPANMVDSLFKFVRKSSPCAKKE